MKDVTTWFTVIVVILALLREWFLRRKISKLSDTILDDRLKNMRKGLRNKRREVRDAKDKWARLRKLRDRARSTDDNS